ncbi:hypothetical protein [Cryptosporangium phraense]|uniref:hypothetical protein n=1 Tax=Cryptosporangium phraense TaxID=2593070 RepID=UPI001478FF32|nr:hypothetical protein [Cryptosporangium phraense]
MNADLYAAARAEVAAQLAEHEEMRQRRIQWAKEDGDWAELARLTGGDIGFD